MKYEKGQSGNLAGRPQGALNKTSQLAKLLHPHAEALIEKAVELALSGDINALRLCIERLIPRAKNEVIDLPIDDMTVTKASTLPLLIEKILSAVSNQQITPEQAKTLCDVVETQRKLIESSELEARITSIEHTLSTRGANHREKSQG